MIVQNAPRGSENKICNAHTPTASRTPYLVGVLSFAHQRQLEMVTAQHGVHRAPAPVGRPLAVDQRHLDVQFALAHHRFRAVRCSAVPEVGQCLRFGAVAGYRAVEENGRWKGN